VEEFVRINEATDLPGQLNKKFLRGPGACFMFFQKEPLAAGTSRLDFLMILESPVNCGKAFIDNCFWDFSRLL
jgi:hypothetical protein